jgi:hypothetical protein
VGTCHRFVAAPAEPLDVLSWFRGLPTPPRVAAEEYGFALLFGDLGPLHYRADGFIDAERSPVVTIHAPKLKRGVLWTVGEVRFLSTPLKKRYPQLHKVNTAFAKWLSGFECVFSRRPKIDQYNYYLEGSIRNYDPPVFAFDSGLTALRAGQYFVDGSETDFRLDTICKILRLRGVNALDA